MAEKSISAEFDGYWRDEDKDRGVKPRDILRADQRIDLQVE
jgi:hypothetical protein